MSIHLPDAESATQDFLERFPNAEAARSYLEAQRWPQGISCPVCGCVDRIQVRKLAGYFRCLACKTDFTVRTGTLLERSHVPLDKWLYALVHGGLSSLQLSKHLGVTQKTAWFMLRRLRDARRNNDNNDGNGFLWGIVDANESRQGRKDLQ